MATVLMALVLLSGASPSPPPAAEQAEIFGAAGFVKMDGSWRTRDCVGLEGASYTPGAIDHYGDLNGDGGPEAVVSEGSGICYGNTGSRFWLLSKQPNGTWKTMASEIGIPEFLPTKGAAGWPDLSVGGPGFCFPVLRWNGNSYANHRLEYEGKPCRDR